MGLRKGTARSSFALAQGSRTGTCKKCVGRVKRCDHIRYAEMTLGEASGCCPTTEVTRRETPRSRSCLAPRLLGNRPRAGGEAGGRRPARRGAEAAAAAAVQVRAPRLRLGGGLHTGRDRKSVV